MNAMNDLLQQHIRNLRGKDRKQQGASFQELMKLTDEPVDWAYEIWDDLVDLLATGNNRARSIAAQVLCNLAKSDPDGRMKKDLPKLFQTTKDEKFVTARHSLLALWRVGIVDPDLTKRTLAGLEKRYRECDEEKNATLIRYDICCVLRKIHDRIGDSGIPQRAKKLIDLETDPKYRKKYLGEWKDILND